MLRGIKRQTSLESPNPKPWTITPNPWAAKTTDDAHLDNLRIRCILRDMRLGVGDTSTSSCLVWSPLESIKPQKVLEFPNHAPSTISSNSGAEKKHKPKCRGKKNKYRGRKDKKTKTDNAVRNGLNKATDVSRIPASWTINPNTWGSKDNRQ